MTVTTVYVVCNFEPLRLGLAQVIASSAELHLAGNAASLAEARRDPAGTPHATYVVDSSQIPDLMASDERSVEHPFRRAVFVGAIPASHDAASVVAHQLHRREAVGFLHNVGSTARLVEAITLVAGGVFVCEMGIAAGLQAETSQTDAQERLKAAMLSPRELEVLERVTRGLANKEIARELYLAEGTVKAHVSHILAKLAVHHRVDLVRFGILIAPDNRSHKSA